MKRKLKKSSYITIQEFMRTELNLKGTDLFIYAIIHGFSQDGKSICNSSYDYFHLWTGRCKESIKHNIDDLIKKGLITRVPLKDKNNYLKYGYYTSLSRTEKKRPRNSDVFEEKKIPEKRPRNFADNVLENRTYNSTDNLEDTTNQIRSILTHILRNRANFIYKGYVPKLADFLSRFFDSSEFDEYLIFVKSELSKNKNIKNFVGAFVSASLDEAYIRRFQAAQSKESQTPPKLPEWNCPNCNSLVVGFICEECNYTFQKFLYEKKQKSEEK